jgi:hypothetical protein
MQKKQRLLTNSQNSFHFLLITNALSKLKVMANNGGLFFDKA